MSTSTLVQQLLLYMSQDADPLYFSFSYWFRLDAAFEMIQSRWLSHKRRNNIRLVTALPLLVTNYWFLFLVLSFLLVPATRAMIRGRKNEYPRSTIHSEAPHHAQATTNKQATGENATASSSERRSILSQSWFAGYGFELPRRYWHGTKLFMILWMLHDALTYFASQTIGNELYHQVWVFIAINLALSPLHAICTQNRIVRTSQFTHVSGISYWRMACLLSAPVIALSIAKVVTICILLPSTWYEVKTESYTLHNGTVILLTSTPRAIWSFVVLGLGSWLTLIQPAAVALHISEAALIPPATHATTTTVQPHSLDEVLGTIKHPGQPTLGSSVSLLRWSWSLTSRERVLRSGCAMGVIFGIAFCALPPRYVSYDSFSLAWPIFGVIA